ncbi:MAG TPA: aldehyde dehydrogenase family protein [Phycisphaerales bacterium]|nr:aldehyde dehydrogenase family protein [Phycisphaerales bacterium]
MKNPMPMWLAGIEKRASGTLAVTDKWTGQEMASVHLADEMLLKEAIAGATDAEGAMRKMSGAQRADALRTIADELGARSEEFARIIMQEAGKPIRAARAEVLRAIGTFRIAAGEATRIGGEYMRLDSIGANAGMEAVSMRVPVGACSFVTPFNFPLNLVAHKVAPAIACGCTFVLKPAPATPVSALMLGEILAKLGMPRGAFSVVPCRNEDAHVLVEDERVKLLSFTGSAEVGWKVKRDAGKKRVVLELGGNAACVVDEGVEVEKVADRIVAGAFTQAGQSCISVQRVLIHGSNYEAMRTALVRKTKGLFSADAEDERTTVGPMISEAAARRVEDWVKGAVSAGGTLLCGGERTGAFHTASIVENVPHTCLLWSEEAFGPVMAIEKFTDFSEAMQVVNDSHYGLQAGVFTNRLDHAMRAWKGLEVGAVVLNDVPSTRADEMPYGGVKDSGIGREGVRSAIRDMTEERLLVMRNG